MSLPPSRAILPSVFRLVASDLDGTLLRDDGSISDRTRATLRRVEARGVPVVLVTARPPRVARVLAARVGVGGPLICCNGAIVYDPERDEIVQHRPFEASAAAALIEAIRAAAPGACFAAEIGFVYGREPAYRALGASNPGGEPFDVVQEQLLDDALALCRDGATKLMVRHADHAADALAALLRELLGEAAVVTHSGGSFVELLAPGVHKAAALAVVCQERGILAAEVVAFGDMPNDLPMLAWAGRAIAVANAHPEVLAACDEVTGTNEDDGVAEALERLLLSG